MTPTEPTTAREDEELAIRYATDVLGIPIRTPIHTVDRHLGNPQRYETHNAVNEDAKCGFLAGRASLREEMNARIEEAVRKERERIEASLQIERLKITRMLKEIVEYLK